MIYNKIETRGHVLLGVGLAVLMFGLGNGCASLGGPLYNLTVKAGRAAAKMEVKTAFAAGHHVAYLEHLGSPSDVTLVMLHGYASNKDAWTGFARLLPPSMHLVAIDLPAHGGSDYFPSQSYDLESQAKRLAKILDAIDVPKAFFIGSSLGGAVATVFAGLFPNRVQGLVLMAPHGPFPKRMTEFQKQFQRGDNPLLIKNVEDLNRVVKLSYAHPPFIPPSMKRFLAQDFAKYQKRNVQVFTDIERAHLPYIPAMHAVQAPTLVLWGHNDHILHPSASRIFVSEIAQADARLYEDCGHSIASDQGERAAKDLVRFLNGLKHAEP